MQNSLAPQTRPQKFSVAIQSDAYKKLINNTLQDPKRAGRFIASVSSAVAVNPSLQECDAGTILSGALLGEALNLSPSPQLGQYFLVPYNDNKRGCNVAQFQLGYKGYIQLAIRSGYYKKINVLPIKKGELVSYNPLDEIIDVNLIEDETVREQAETVGYYAMFEYMNGFRKTLYWSREKMQAHADRYSKAYSAESHAKLISGEIPKGDMWKYSSFWYSNFDMMACKTMIRQLISQWGNMSVEMMDAVEKDMGVINTDCKVQFVDNDAPAAPAPEAVVVVEPQEEADPLAD